MTCPNEVVDVFLQPGEFFVGDALFRIRTLLGSCVSITLWHRARKIGAMSHFLLPARPDQDGDGGTLNGQYGADALTLMLQELGRLGIGARDCQAKLFGGGDMFPQQRRCGESVGQKNGRAAYALLEQHGITLASQSLFGSGYRQIVFDVASGDVWARQLTTPLPQSNWGIAA
jgi:chemotaxis protein CheD